MARQQTIPQQIQRVAATVPAFAGIALVSGSQQATSSLCLLVGSAEKFAFRLLLDLVPAAFHAFQGCVSDSYWSSISAGHLLVTTWHVLARVIGAA